MIKVILLIMALKNLNYFVEFVSHRNRSKISHHSKKDILNKVGWSAYNGIKIKNDLGYNLQKSYIFQHEENFFD